MSLSAALVGASIVSSDGGPFDLIVGLPVHPLVVHLAVIVLPAAAAALIVVMLLPRVPFLVRWGVVAALAVGALSAWVAAESGEELSDRVGDQPIHEALGENLPAFAAITFALGLVWAVIAEVSVRASRTATEGGAPTPRGLLPLRIIAAAAAAGMAAFTIYYTVLVGHSGAVATWLPRIGG